MFQITQSTRLRPSPFYQATLAEGVTSFTVYNHMLMPTGYGDPEGEYWRLINGASQWDVAVERQVEITGPDAGRLAQCLAPRDLTNFGVGAGKYIPLCNHAGTLINDPILLKLDEDRYWLSIADSDVLFWVRAVAGERGFDAKVSEPDVSPMAVQGPKAEDVIASVFGDWVRKLKYFWFRETTIEGIPVVVARSGWSKQGGFEVYLMDGSKGTALWNLVREAGAPWDIGPGNPNACEHIESGLLSWGGDTDDETNPFEVRLGRYIDLDVADDVVAIEALRRISENGPKRRQLGIVLNAKAPGELERRWCGVYRDGDFVGHMTNTVWSYRLKKHIGFALVSGKCDVSDEVTVRGNDRSVDGILTELPFL